MDARGSRLWTAPLVALALATAAPAAAQMPVALGDQFQVNSYTTGAQAWAAVASAPDGRFVVVWESYGSPATDSSSDSIQGQRYAADGLPLGPQFQVNSYTTSAQERPAVAIDGDGNFVVVWQSFLQGLVGQRYTADGTAAGGEFQVDSYPGGSPQESAVAMVPDGTFVVTWQSHGSPGTDSLPGSKTSIQARRFSADGTPQGAQFQVNSYTTSYQRNPAVAAAPDGAFLVVWDGVTGRIQGQRYAADGSPLGGEFAVQPDTPNSQLSPAVAADASGDVVVVWTDNGFAETNAHSIRGQRLRADGSALGGQFQVDSYTVNYQSHASLAAADDGSFVVVWQTIGSAAEPSGGWTVQGRHYGADGAPTSEQFQLGSYLPSNATFPAVASESTGDFVAVWSASFQPGTDSQASVQGRRFALVPPVPALSAPFAGACALLLLAVARTLRRRA